MSDLLGEVDVVEPPHYYSPYGYIPTDWVCILFIVLFSISTLLHFGQAIRFRMWWLLPTAVLAGLSEIIGWSGRYWSSQRAYMLDPFLMQITTTILAPTPLVAANFIILGKIIARLGPQYSRLGPKLYTIVFCFFDLIALIVQAVGGAGASGAVENGRDPAPGGHVMLGGIATQMVAITIYVSLASEFLWRYFTDRPVRRITTTPRVPDDSTLVSSDHNAHAEKADGATYRRGLTRRLQLMILGLVFSTLVIFIRAVYRTIELSDGWTGRIITTQVYFNVLDGAMITLAMYTLNILHPGVLLREN